MSHALYFHISKLPKWPSSPQKVYENNAAIRIRQRIVSNNITGFVESINTEIVLCIHWLNDWSTIWQLFKRMSQTMNVLKYWTLRKRYRFKFIYPQTTYRALPKMDTCYISSGCWGKHMMGEGLSISCAWGGGGLCSLLLHASTGCVKVRLLGTVA